MLNSITVHRVESVKLKSTFIDNFNAHSLVVKFLDFSGNTQETEISLFGDGASDVSVIAKDLNFVAFEREENE